MDYTEIVRLHSVWRLMKVRCFDPRNISYKDYGARGIFVCEAWLEFNTFCDWALAAGSARGLQIDRTDNDGPYAPDNCRFVTRTENMRNKRSSNIITALGETKNLSAWAEDPRCCVPTDVVRRRIKAGWDASEAITVKRTRDRQLGNFTCGHPMSEDNTYRRSATGYRMCKICTKKRALSAARRNKAKGYDK